MNPQELIEKASKLAECLGIEAEFIAHSESGASTAQAETALNEQPENILKCLILNDKKREQFIGAVIRGDTKLDMKRISELTGIKRLEFSEPNLIEELTGFKIGGVPPISIIYCRYRFVCDLVFEREYVIGAGGHDQCGMKLKPNDFRKIEMLTIARISKT